MKTMMADGCFSLIKTRLSNGQARKIRRASSEKTQLSFHASNLSNNETERALSLNRPSTQESVSQVIISITVKKASV